MIMMIMTMMMMMNTESAQGMTNYTTIDCGSSFFDCHAHVTDKRATLLLTVKHLQCADGLA